MRWSKPAAWSLTVAATALAVVRLGAQRVPGEGEWPNYFGGTNGGKYSPLAQISKDNVKDLRIAWRWRSADRASAAVESAVPGRPQRRDAADGQRGALHRDRPRLRGGPRPGDRATRAGSTIPSSYKAGVPEQRRLPPARTRLLDRRAAPNACSSGRRMPICVSIDATNRQARLAVRRSTARPT